jgi:hypothetical protein
MKATTSPPPAAAPGGARSAVEATVAGTAARREALAAHRSRSRLRIDPFQQQHDGFASRCKRAFGAWLARARETPAA